MDWRLTKEAVHEQFLDSTKDGVGLLLTLDWKLKLQLKLEAVFYSDEIQDAKWKLTP